MCLAVPGKVIEVKAHPVDAELGATGLVDFQGSRLEASLAFTPEVKVGDWVLVHAGFALRVLDEQEAIETWKYLQPEDVEDLPGR